MREGESHLSPCLLWPLVVLLPGSQCLLDKRSDGYDRGSGEVLNTCAKDSAHMGTETLKLLLPPRVKELLSSLRYS